MNARFAKSFFDRICIIMIVIGTLGCLPENALRVSAQSGPAPLPSRPRPNLPASIRLASSQDVVSAFKAICRRNREPKPGEAVRYLLVVGPTITDTSIKQLLMLTEANTNGRGGLIAIALLSNDHPQYNAIVSGVGNSTSLGLINTYPHPERIDATFFVGFSNDGSNPRGSQIIERFSNPRLDVLVERALTEWGDVYVFASPGLWTPIDREAIKTVAQSAKKIVWAGDKNGDDVTDFFASVRSRNQQKGRID